MMGEAGCLAKSCRSRGQVPGAEPACLVDMVGLPHGIRAQKKVGKAAECHQSARWVPRFLANVYRRRATKSLPASTPYMAGCLVGAQPLSRLVLP